MKGEKVVGCKGGNCGWGGGGDGDGGDGGSGDGDGSEGLGGGGEGLGGGGDGDGGDGDGGEGRGGGGEGLGGGGDGDGVDSGGVGGDGEGRCLSCSSGVAAVTAIPSALTQSESSAVEQHMSYAVCSYPESPRPAHATGPVSAALSAQKLPSAAEASHATSMHVSVPHGSGRHI